MLVIIAGFFSERLREQRAPVSAATERRNPCLALEPNGATPAWLGAIVGGALLLALAIPVLSLNLRICRRKQRSARLDHEACLRFDR
ncbi:MAG: hypothetical protein R2845_08245 [Thermomicrobiales bacterium]